MNNGGVTEVTIENYIQAINDGTLKRRVDEVHVELARLFKLEQRPYTANEIVQNLRKSNLAHYNVNSALAWLEDWNIVKRTPKRPCTASDKKHVAYGWALTFEPPRFVGLPKLPTKKELIAQIEAQAERIRELTDKNIQLEDQVTAQLEHLQSKPFEEGERFVCQRCKGTGYVTEEQGTFDI
jgi:hypothetical protein